MNIEPLKHYDEPVFPTYSVLDEHPELLMLVPNRWRGNTTVLTALAGVAFLISGCGRDDKAASDVSTPAVTSQVAPIFQHGDGRGSFGCVAVNPPVILSEDEAREIIEKEAKKEGINFVREVTLLPKVSVPVTYPWEEDIEPGKSSVNPKFHSKQLKVDGTDRKHNISYEFISTQDFMDWQGENLRCSTVTHYDTLSAAKLLNEGLSQAKLTDKYAVFYDPMSRPPKIEYPRDDKNKIDWKARKALTEETAKEELRKQVRDFIKWLKAEGVI